MNPDRLGKALQRARRAADGGDKAGALRELAALLAQAPKAVAAWLLLGQVQGGAGQHAAAEASFRRATELQPENHDAWLNLGLTHYLRHDFAAALPSFQRAATLVAAPSRQLASLLATCCVQLDRYAEAIEVLDFLDRSFGESIDAAMLGGMACQGLDRYPEALAAYRRALELGAGGATVHLNLGTCYHVLDDYENAALHAERALALDPANAAVAFNLGSALLAAGRIDESLSAFERSPLRAALSQRLLAANYLAAMTPAALRALHEQLVGLLAGDVVQLAPRPLPAAGARIRLGLLSPDLRQHPVAHFFAGCFANLDRARFELFVYSDVRREDAVTARFRAHGDAWRECFGVADAVVAQRIGDDRIDVLIDLAGHTGSRLRLLAMKPAPLQLAYLGYAATTGLPQVDCYVTDHVLDAAGDEAFYTERLLRLDGVYASYTPPELAIEVAPEPPLLRHGHATFGCFAQPQKISPVARTLWAEAMQALPGSRLRVMGKGMEHAAAQHRFVAEFVAAGIEPGRVEFRGAGSLTEFLAAHDDIDLILDTVPWNGHTTTLHALWMGVPTASVRGDRHVGRFAEAVLRELGLDDFVAPSAADFASRVAALCADLPRLRQLRRTLRAQLLASPLCDHAAMARRLEQAITRALADATTTPSGAPRT